MLKKLLLGVIFVASGLNAANQKVAYSAVTKKKLPTHNISKDLETFETIPWSIINDNTPLQQCQNNIRSHERTLIGKYPKNESKKIHQSAVIALKESEFLDRFSKTTLAFYNGESIEKCEKDINASKAYFSNIYPNDREVMEEYAEYAHFIISTKER